MIYVFDVEVFKYDWRNYNESWDYRRRHYRAQKTQVP